MSSRSVGKDYGDVAIGYVQLLRRDGLCKIASRIVPEYRVTTKPYSEYEKEILMSNVKTAQQHRGLVSLRLLLYGGLRDAALRNQSHQ